MQNQPGAIVLGANAIALGIVRSLGAHGIPVWVYDPSRSMAHFSKYATRKVVSDRDKHELLLEDGKRYNLNGWVIYPVEDSYVELLSVHHRSLSSIYRVTTAPLEVTRFALDKRLTYLKAMELGIATPWTLVGSDLADVSVNDLPYPLILKPAINHHFFPHTNLKALTVDSASEFYRKFHEMSRYIPAEEILIQERIPGSGDNQFSCAALCNDGRVVASIAARRTRQYPLDFGRASTFVETANQPVVEMNGRRWLESIGFDGMAEVEFKFDPRDGKYKILDVNVRAWGWHTMGKAAGIDFSYLLFQQKLGNPVSSIPSPQPATWIREFNDLIAISKSPNRLEEIKKTIRAVRNSSFAWSTLDSSDPMPALAELALRVIDGLPALKKKTAPSVGKVVFPRPAEVGFDFTGEAAD